MKHTMLALMCIFTSFIAHSESDNRKLDLSCQNFSWGDVEELVQPYLNDSQYANLVMQGLSSEYRTSAAAHQAMKATLPKVIKRMLTSLIEADC